MIAAKVITFARLLRFQYHHNFIAVILGAFCFSSTVTKKLISDVAFQYLSFGIALYGGIYILNGITDANQDKNYQRKRSRPIPQGIISKKEASCLLGTLWILAFLSIYLYDGSSRFWPIYLSFIAVNLAYSLYLRKTPLRFLIGITCPMRLYLGAMITSASVPWTAYGIAFFFMCAVQALKSDSESHENWGRGVSHSILIVLLLIGSTSLWILQYPRHLSFLDIVAASHVAFIIIPYIFPVLGVYLFGADVITSQDDKLPFHIIKALTKNKDIKGFFVFLILFFVAYLNRFLIALEEVIFPRLPNLDLKNVVFILGHQRSGTTYLHKALHQLPGIHSSSFYDLWFASFILKVIGRPCLPLIDFIIRHWSTQNHPIDVHEELEEYFWLIMRFKSIAIPYIFPSLINETQLIDKFLSYTDDDFLFFKKCLQRVLYKKSSSLVYVGRPLSLTANYFSLRRHFPNAKIILCVRHPVDIMTSWVDHSANVIKSSLNSVKFQEFMEYVYQNYSKKVFQSMNLIFHTDSDNVNRLVYVVLFDRIKHNIHSEIEAILAFIELKNDQNELECHFTKTEDKQHSNREESHDIISLDEDDILSYQNIVKLTLVKERH